jgi:hypothetical protein
MSKYSKLEEQLQSTKDRVYLKRVISTVLSYRNRSRKQRVEMMMQNYAETLEEENWELHSKVQAAIADKQTAKRSSAKYKKLAKDRLERWHAERHLRRVAQDHAAQQKKIATQMQQITEKYEAFINKSEDTKRKLQKEWADEEAAHRRGGARRWPIWVVQWVIKKEKHEDIPTEPPIKMPQRMSLPALGTLTSQVASLDEKYKANESKLKAKAIKMRLERESKGEGSMHSQLQPFSRPDIEDLIGKRIDVLCSVEVDDNAQALKWCQGKVLSVIAENKVEVEWDPAPDIEGCEESTVGEQVLLPSKWNKDKKDGAWRMDVDIDIEDTMDDESEDESEVEVEFESNDESESGSE